MSKALPNSYLRPLFYLKYTYAKLNGLSFQYMLWAVVKKLLDLISMGKYLVTLILCSGPISTERYYNMCLSTFKQRFYLVIKYWKIQILVSSCVTLKELSLKFHLLSSSYTSYQIWMQTKEIHMFSLKVVNWALFLLG